MTAPKISHLTLNTGRCRQYSPRDEVSDDVLATIAPWLDAAVESGAIVKIPKFEYRVQARAVQGAISMEVYAPEPDVGPDIPVASIAVAQQEQAAEIWSAYRPLPGVVPWVKMPKAPFCLVLLHPTIMMYRDALEWLGDFERIVAWAWITQHPSLSSADEP